MTRTLSPVLTGSRRTLWFLVRSSDSRAASIRRRRCCGALKNFFLCFDGFELAILDHRARQVRDSWPTLSSLLCHRSADLGAFELTLRSHYNRSVILKAQTGAIGSPDSSCLSYDDGWKDLFSEAG